MMMKFPLCTSLPLAMNVFGFLSNPPERTRPKPRKCHCETNCNRHPSEASLAGVIFCVFVGHRRSAAGRHDQENKARNLQLQLVQYLPEGSGRREDAPLHGTHGAAALDLLRGHARYHPHLLCGRNLAHDSILTVSRSTITQTCAAIETVSAGTGI